MEAVHVSNADEEREILRRCTGLQDGRSNAYQIVNERAMLVRTIVNSWQNSRPSTGEPCCSWRELPWQRFSDTSEEATHRPRFVIHTRMVSSVVQGSKYRDDE